MECRIKKNKLRSITKIISVGVFSTVFFSGCISNGLEYKKYGVSYPTQVGYSDFKIKENQWKVTYTGPTNSSTQFAMEYMYKRAREICIENGYKDFEVVDENQLSKNNNSQYFGYGYSVSNNQPVSSATVRCK